MKYTLLQKKHNFSESIFPADPGSLTLTPGHVHFVNTLQSSSIYTLPKKKRNFPCCVSFEEECNGSPITKGTIRSCYDSKRQVWATFVTKKCFPNIGKRGFVTRSAEGMGIVKTMSPESFYICVMYVL